MKTKFTILIVLISFVLAAQDSNDTLRFLITKSGTLQFQKIDIEQEKDNIIQFIKDFGKQVDPVKIQDDILFPYLFVRHKCDPFYPASLYFFRKADNLILGEMPRYFHDLIGNGEDYDSLKMNQARNQLKCNNPIFPYEYFYDHSTAFRDSIDNLNLTVKEFFFQDPKNRTDYCNWFIHAYKFPVFHSIDSHQELGKFNETSIGIDGKILPVVSVWSLCIVKVNNEFRVVSLTYPYN